MARRRCRRLAAAVAAALVALGTMTAGDTPTATAAEPASVVIARYNDDEGQTGDVPLPECGSRNINGRGNYGGAEWRVTSTLASGSTVYVGDTWQITARVYSSMWNPVGNDGPDPLVLELVPNGLVAQVGRTASYDPVHNGGDGWVGSLGPVGTWGWGFDTDSDPVITPSDGAVAQIEVTMKATAPGVIDLTYFRVSGHDSTPPAANFACLMDVGWYWYVDELEPPAGKADSATTDARYPAVLPEDANGGTHAVDINVLGNDDDANTPAPAGTVDDVRIAAWQVSSTHGGQVSCGTPDQQAAPADAAFSSLSAGPCRYTPPVGYAGPDSFTYTLRQRTKGAQAVVPVHVVVAGNKAPVMPEIVLNGLQNTQEVFDLTPLIVDPEGDGFTCLPALPEPAVGGDVIVDADCDVQWTPEPGFTGNGSFTVRSCDTHPTVPEAENGFHATRAPGYSDGDPDDLSGAATRRCGDVTANVHVSTGLVAVPSGYPDEEIVDAGYAEDGVGPYTVVLPVLENDIDANGPEPGSPGWGGTVDVLSVDPSLGTAVVDGDTIRFTPADGVSGPVQFTYRLCEDPLQQDPPYVDDAETPIINEGLPMCGVGMANIVVHDNQEPTAVDDHVVVADGGSVDIDVAVNDFEPDGELLSCIAGALPADPGLLAAATMDPDCQAHVTGVAGAAGLVEVPYVVCDDHTLTAPGGPATPYGADGRSPGELAPRCSTAKIHVEVLSSDPADPDPPNDGGGGGSGGGDGNGDGGAGDDDGNGGSGDDGGDGGAGDDDGTGGSGGSGGSGGNGGGTDDDGDRDDVGVAGDGADDGSDGAVGARGALARTGHTLDRLAGVALAVVAAGLLLVVLARRSSVLAG